MFKNNFYYHSITRFAMVYVTSSYNNPPLRKVSRL